MLEIKSFSLSEYGFFKKKCGVLGCKKHKKVGNRCANHPLPVHVPKKRIYDKDYDSKRFRTPKGRYSLAKHQAKRRELVWEISYELFCCLINSRCSYCHQLTPESTGSGLDRVDNEKGYSVENVIPCCGMCNRLRGVNFTVEETRVMVSALLKFRTGETCRNQ
jgi:hypothetical protein